VAGAAIAPLAQALAGPATITITDREVEHARVDVGRRGPSVGDMEFSRSLLYNKRIREKPIGHSEVTCIATGQTSSSCTGTYFLPKGKIVVIGPTRFRELYELAVVGGTGLYANARGTLTVTSLGTRPARALLVFRLGI
jgi:hypothetical protein